jgi:hypothetical protein
VTKAHVHEDVDQQKLAAYKRWMKVHTDAIKEYLAEFIEKNAVLAPQGATADGPKNEIWRTAETLAPIQLAPSATCRAQVVNSNQTQVEMLEIPT